MEFVLSLSFLLLSSLVTLGLGWYTWRSRTLPGVLPFAFILFLGLLWIAADTLELTFPGLEAKIICLNVVYLAYSFLPVAWVALVFDHVGRGSQLNAPILALLSLIPAATQVLTWTNTHHHLLRTAEWLKTASPYTVVAYTPGPWHWVYVLHSRALLATAATVLIASILAGPRVHRRQPVVLLGACLLSLILGSLRTWELHDTYALHLFTPVALSGAGALAAWALFRCRLFRLAPVARHALVENMTEGVLVLDETDRVVDLNRAAQRVIGKPGSQALSQPLAEVWDAWRQVTASREAGKMRTQLQLEQDRKARHYEVECSPLKQGSCLAGHLVVLRDVTDRAVMEENLRQQALTDHLTGLPNRALFMAKLDESIRKARRHPDMGFAVLVLDLDRFKMINDSIGHLAGDVLLQSTATKLRHCVREVDTVARMGGDEFMIILDRISSAQEVLPVLERIRAELQTPVFFRQQEISTTCSIGVMIWDPSYSNPEDLLRAADTAMYQAKEAGRNCYRVFDEEMHQAVLHVLKAETELRAAIRKRELTVVYQPIVDLKTGVVCALESLIRWEHAERGTILPEEFISVAENSGLIVPMGAAVLDHVFAQMTSWRDSREAPAELPVSLNVSPRQLGEPDFAASLAKRLAESRIPADQVALEMTESMFVEDPEKSLEMISELRRLGIRLCLDDFGTGSSSLQHLITFPVHELKIDQTFISRVGTGNTDYAVVRSLTDLAHTLGLTVTAEGIEEPEQWALLVEIGCDRGQGYYLGCPMSPAELLDYLEENKRRSNMRVLRRAGQSTPSAPHHR